MSKLFPSYEERQRKPFLSIINFEYLLTHSEAIIELKEKYYINPVVKQLVDEKIFRDKIFASKFSKYFKEKQFSKK